MIVAGDGPELQLERMAAARRRALAKDPADRRWSLTFPDGTVPLEMTLDDELDLVGWQTD